MAIGIYEIFNTANGKRYIGGSRRMLDRWRQHISHLNRGVHHSRVLQRAWNKYGCENFVFRIITPCGDEDLVSAEQAAFDLFKPQCNCNPIAERPPLNLGPMSEERKRKISEAQKGKPRPYARAPLSPEHKSKIRASRLAWDTPESRAQISKSLMGHPVSKEARKKISESLKARCRETQ